MTRVLWSYSSKPSKINNKFNFGGFKSYEELALCMKSSVSSAKNAFEDKKMNFLSDLYTDEKEIYDMELGFDSKKYGELDFSYFKNSFISCKFHVYNLMGTNTVHIDNDYLLLKYPENPKDMIVSNAEKNDCYMYAYRRPIDIFKDLGLEIPRLWSLADKEQISWNLGVVSFLNKSLYARYMEEVKEIINFVQKDEISKLLAKPPYWGFEVAVNCLVEQLTLSGLLIDMGIVPTTVSSIVDYSGESAMIAQEEKSMIHGFGVIGKRNLVSYLRKNLV